MTSRLASILVAEESMNKAHETALKLLDTKMRQMGWKLKKASTSAEMEWAWKKGDETISISGWAPKPRWSDSFMFHEVLHSKGFAAISSIWKNPVDIRSVKYEGEKSMLPDHLKMAFEHSIAEAPRAVLKLAESLR